MKLPHVFFPVATSLALSALISTAAPAKTSVDKVKKETAEAVDAAGAYAGEKKEEFAARMKGNLDEMDRQIQDLRKESDTKSNEVREATKKKIRELQSKRDEMNQRYNDLEKSTGKAWMHMKTGVEKAWGSVRQAYGEAKSELSSQK